MRINKSYKYKKIYLNIILFLSSFCFTILFIEAFLRVFPLNNNLYYRDLEWNHWGNSEMIKLYNELYVYNDELGYERKDIYERIKTVLRNDSQSYKILILGDSITQWGKYVDYFNNLLAERYNEGIEVVNAGVMGYDTALEYRYLKHRGLELRPNLVILQFCVNDFRGTPIIIKQKDGSWFALNGNEKIVKWISPKLIAKSKLYEFITLRLLYLSRGEGINRNTVDVPLRKMKQLLKEKDIAFYILIFPWLAESQCIEAGYDDHREILDILDELNLSSQVIDLLPYYSRASFHKIRNDLIHPNDEGDKIAAQVLMNKLGHFLDERINSN